MIKCAAALSGNGVTMRLLMELLRMESRTGLKVLASLPVDETEYDGARGWKEFWHIVLPAVWPTVMVFLVSGVSGIFLNQIHLWSFYDYDAPVQLQTYGYILYHESTEIITTSAVNDSKANILSSFAFLLSFSGAFPCLAAFAF